MSRDGNQAQPSTDSETPTREELLIRAKEKARTIAADTEIRLARVPSAEIGYINSIVESYEGIGMVRTRDPKMGVIEFWIIPDFKEEFLNLIEELRKEIPIVWLPKAASDCKFGIIDGIGYDPENPQAEG